MSPTEAEDVFYAAYNKWLIGRDFDKPLVQAEGRAYAWACVIRAIRDARFNHFLHDLIVVGVALGIVAGYLVCKLAG